MFSLCNRQDKRPLAGCCFTVWCVYFTHCIRPTGINDFWEDALRFTYLLCVLNCFLETQFVLRLKYYDQLYKKIVTSVSAPFVVSCPSGIWGAGGGGTDGETISSAEAWVKEHLPLWAATFLGHFLKRSCQSLLYLQGASRALRKHTSSLCAKACKKGRPQLSWIKHQTSPAMHCFPHSSPPSRKPRLPLFIRTLITQSESPGLQFPLQRRRWLLRWRWSPIILVMSGWYVPPAGIPAGGGAPQAALPVSSSQGRGLEKRAPCSALPLWWDHL